MAKLKPKQMEMPGFTEDAVIQSLVNAADNYCEHRDKRIAEGKLEAEAKDVLMKLMAMHDKTFYRYRGRIIKITTEIGIKVTSKDDDNAMTPMEARRSKADIAEVAPTPAPIQPELSADESLSNVVSFFDRKERSGDELAKLKSPLDVYVSQEELAQFAKTECAKNLPKKKCTISKTFQLGEGLYVCTSFMRAGEQIETLLAYRLVEKEKFPGDLTSFEDTRTTGNLHGLLVWQRGWEYVLCGPPIIFRDKANLPEESTPVFNAGTSELIEEAEAHIEFMRSIAEKEESGTVELERFEYVETEATQGTPVKTQRNQFDLAEWAEDAATSLITEGKGGIKRIYVDGNPYVITGYMSSKDGVEEVYAHAVLPVSIVGEENAVTYSERSQAYYAGGIPAGPMSYAGIKINCGNKKKPDWWVMLGEQVTFTVAPRNAAPVTRKPTLDEISNYLIVHSETGEVPNLASHARKLQISGAKDAEVIAWLKQIEKEDYPEAEAEDDFTAEICSECDRIDGAHDVNCSQHPDYIAPAPGKPKKPRDLPSGWVFDSTLEEGFRAIKGTKRTLMFNKRVECIVAAHELEKGIG